MSVREMHGLDPEIMGRLRFMDTLGKVELAALGWDVTETELRLETYVQSNPHDMPRLIWAVLVRVPELEHSLVASGTVFLPRDTLLHEDLQHWRELLTSLVQDTHLNLQLKRASMCYD